MDIEPELLTTIVTEVLKVVGVAVGILLTAMGVMGKIIVTVIVNHISGIDKKVGEHSASLLEHKYQIMHINNKLGITND